MITVLKLISRSLIFSDAYTPIQLDARYGAPTNTPLSTAGGLPRNRVGQSNVLGMSALDEESTPSFFTGDVTKRAIERLQQQSDPWFVTASFHSPVSNIVVGKPTDYAFAEWAEMYCGSTLRVFFL